MTHEKGDNEAMAGEFDQILERLEGISDELADIAMGRLRSSLDDEDVDSAIDERKITRARRAIEKAAHLLSEPVTDDY